MMAKEIVVGLAVRPSCRDHCQEVYIVEGWSRGLWNSYVQCRKDDRLFYFRPEELRIADESGPNPS